MNETIVEILYTGYKTWLSIITIVNYYKTVRLFNGKISCRYNAEKLMYHNFCFEYDGASVQRLMFQLHKAIVYYVHIHSKWLVF